MKFNPIKTSLPKGFANISQVNNQLAREKEAAVPMGHRQKKDRDEVKINPMTRVNNIVEAFNQQKKNISEQRSKLVASTLESGGTMDSIKLQLEAYDEKLSSIDQQMAEALARQAEQMLEETKKEQEPKNDQPKTKEEINAAKMDNVVSVNAGIKQTEVITSVKDKVDGEIRVLEQEIKMDRAAVPYMIDSVEGKLEKLSELKTFSKNLSDNAAEMYGEASQKLDNFNEQKIEKDEKTALGQSDILEKDKEDK